METKHFSKIAASVLILIGALWLRLLSINVLGLGDHEMPSLHWALNSDLGESNGLLYHDAFLPLWIAIFGDSTLSLRLASVICSLGAIAGVFAIGLELGSYRLGLAAAFWLGICDADILFSQHIRFHELNTCLCTWSVWAFIRALHRDTKRSWRLYFLTIALSIGSMVLTYVFFCLKWFGYVIFTKQRHSALKRLLPCWLGASALFGGLWAIDNVAYGRIDLLDPPTFSALLAPLADFFAYISKDDIINGTLKDNTSWIILAAISLTALWPLLSLLRSKRLFWKRDIGWLWIATLGTILAIWTGSYLIKPIYKYSNLTFLPPFSALLIAMGFCRLPRYGRYALLITLLATSGPSNTGPTSIDQYSSRAMSDLIVSYAQRHPGSNSNDYSAYPAYIYGFPWGLYSKDMLAHNMCVFVDIFQNYKSFTYNVNSIDDKGIKDITFHSRDQAFPDLCDIWYYTPVEINDNHINYLTEILHPRWIATYKYNGIPLLCRIRIDKRNRDNAKSEDIGKLN